MVRIQIGEGQVLWDCGVTHDNMRHIKALIMLKLFGTGISRDAAPPGGHNHCQKSLTELFPDSWQAGSGSGKSSLDGAPASQID